MFMDKIFVAADVRRLTSIPSENQSLPMNGARVCDPQQLRRAERAQTELKCLETRTLLRLTEPRSVRWSHAAPFWRSDSSHVGCYDL